MRDAIGFRTVSPTVQQRANFGRTASDAFTAEYERGGPCARVRGFATSQHARVTAGSAAQIGKRLAYVPDAAASLDVERTVRALTGALQLSYSGPTFSDDLQRQPLGSALLVGGRLTLRGADGSALSLAVDNLTDKVYLTSVDRIGPPASVTLRLTLPVGRAYASGRGVRPIMISSPSTRTSKRSRIWIGSFGILPVSRSKVQACHGQVTLLPSTQPSQSGPPWCGQALSTA